MRGQGGTLSNLSALMSRGRLGGSSNRDAKEMIIYTTALREARAVAHVVSR